MTRGGARGAQYEVIPSSWIDWLRDRIAWLVVPVVALMVRVLHPHQVTLLLTLGVLGGIVVFVSLHPDWWLVALLTLLPFQLASLSWLYATGVAPELVRPIGNWKDTVVAGLVLAGAREVVAGRRRLDALDKLALAWIVLVLVYVFVFPGLLFPDRGSGVYGGLQAVRSYAGMSLLFLGARHAPLRSDTPRRCVRGMQIAALVVCAGATVEFVAPDWWNSFAVDVIRFPRYLLGVLRLPNAIVYDADGEITVVRSSIVAGRELTRVSSIMFAPLILGFYLLIPFAVTVVQIARGHARRGAYLAATLIAFAMIFTLTRSALVGALAIVLAGIGVASAGSTRVRYALVAALGVLVLGPFGADAGLSARNSETFEPGVAADVGHPEALRTGLVDLVGQPLGSGLGTARYGGDQAYFQLGNELGVIGLVVFVVGLVLVLRALRRVARDPDLGPPDDVALWAAGAFIGGVGIAVTSLIILAWNEINTAWLFWGLAGAVIGVASRRPAEHAARSEPAPA